MVKHLGLLMVIPMMIVALISTCFGEIDKSNSFFVSAEDTVVCQEVIDREPIGAGEIFPNDIKVLNCFTRVTGAQKDTEIIHNWYFEDNLVSSVTLPVKSKNWRTFSKKSILLENKGGWKIEILSADGSLLKRIYFLIN